MKRYSSLLSILILMALAACNLQAPRIAAPAAVTEAPTAAVVETQVVAVPTDTAAPTAEPTFTAAAPLLPTDVVPVPAQPTATPAPPTPAVEAAVAQPTATQAAPAAASTPVTSFDPRTVYGKPKYENPMQFPNLGEWAQAETKKLPDNRDIRLQFKDGELYVTGKRPGFSTWWFSYHTLKDAYIEMTFENENCSGEDAYGIIFRGPPHLAGISYGYVVSFTCSGKLWVYRLDDATPFESENLIDEQAFDAINSGADEENVIGVRTEGETITIFANGVQIAEVTDDHFEKGRVGVFVRAEWPGEYTYRVTNFAYWILGEEK